MKIFIFLFYFDRVQQGIFLKPFFCVIRNKLTISGTSLLPLGKSEFQSISISMDQNQLYQLLKAERKLPAFAKGTPVSFEFRR